MRSNACCVYTHEGNVYVTFIFNSTIHYLGDSIEGVLCRIGQDVVLCHIYIITAYTYISSPNPVFNLVHF